MHLKFSTSEKWVLDQTSIFAQVDAFVQRCKDLLEVCYSQNCLPCYYFYIWCKIVVNSCGILPCACFAIRTLCSGET